MLEEKSEDAENLIPQAKPEDGMMIELNPNPKGDWKCQRPLWW
jgi:hypothetical protein